MYVLFVCFRYFGIYDRSTIPRNPHVSVVEEILFIMLCVFPSFFQSCMPCVCVLWHVFVFTFLYSLVWLCFVTTIFPVHSHLSLGVSFFLRLHIKHCRAVFYVSYKCVVIRSWSWCFHSKC